MQWSGETGKVPPDRLAARRLGRARESSNNTYPPRAVEAACASPREPAIYEQCVARHKITREKRVWRDRDACLRWFKYGDPALNLDDWELADESVPFWGGNMLHPKPDGTDGLGPLYDTPDFMPADGSPKPARRR